MARLERGPGGHFFNWYDPATGDRLTTWPADGSHIYPFLSTVDNAWLAAALHIVARAERPYAIDERRIEDSSVDR